MVRKEEKERKNWKDCERGNGEDWNGEWRRRRGSKSKEKWRRDEFWWRERDGIKKEDGGINKRKGIK